MEDTAIDDWSARTSDKAPVADMLKVMTGRHAGAAMRLTSRTYSIGSDEMCDFIFLDDGFANGSLTLDLTGELPRLTVPEGVSALIGGLPIGRTEMVLGCYESVTVGDTRFAIGPANEVWPEVPAEAPPTAAAPETGASPSDVPTSSTESPIAGAPPPGSSGMEAGHVPLEDLHWRMNSAPPAAGRFPWLVKHKNSLAVGGVILFLGLMFFHTRPGPPQVPFLRVQVLMVLENLRLNEVEIEGWDDSVKVTGYVPTERARDSLLLVLTSLGRPVAVAIHSVESVALGVQNILEMYKMDLSVKVTPRGVVILKGIYGDRPRVRNIIESLRGEVAGIASIEDSVLSTDAVQPFLSETLARHGLRRKMSFETDRGRLYGVLVKDKTRKQDLESWREIKAEIMAAYGLEAQDRWTDKPSPALLRSASASFELNTDLMAVGVGPLNYLTMRDGKKYFEGTRLKSGHIIKSIQKDRIVLVEDGVEDIYYLQEGIR